MERRKGAKALVSGGCVISGEINFEYRTFFSKQWCIIPRFTERFVQNVEFVRCILLTKIKRVIIVEIFNITRIF